MNVLKALIRTCVSFLLLLSVINQYVFLEKHFMIYKLGVFHHFHKQKNTNADGIHFLFFECL